MFDFLINSDKELSKYNKLNKDMNSFNCLMKNSCLKIKMEDNSKKLNKERYYAKSYEQKEALSDKIEKLKTVSLFHECSFNHCGNIIREQIKTSVNYWDNFFRNGIFSQDKIALKQLDKLKELVEKDFTISNYKKMRPLYIQLLQKITIYEINYFLDIISDMRKLFSKKQLELFNKLNGIMKKEFNYDNYTNAKKIRTLLLLNLLGDDKFKKELPKLLKEI